MHASTVRSRFFMAATSSALALTLSVAAVAAGEQASGAGGRLLVPPRLSDLPKPDWARGVAPLPAATGDGSAVEEMLLGGAASRIKYLFPNPKVYGGEWTAIADFNGDGRLDLACADEYAGNPRPLRVHYGRSDGTFGIPQEAYTITVQGAGPGHYPSCLAVGDFNDDPWPDLVVRLYDQSVVLLMNQGNGTFITGNTYSHLGSGGLFVGDFDHDGFSDVVEPPNNWENYPVVRRGLGEGILADGIPLVLPVYAWSSSQYGIADLNGDEVDDFYGSIAGSVWIAFGKAGRGLLGSDSIELPLWGTSAPIVVMTGDFDGDRMRDVAVAGTGSYPWFRLYWGETGGVFSSAHDYPADAFSETSRVAAVADVNGDGRDDIVVQTHHTLRTNAYDRRTTVLYGRDRDGFRTVATDSYASRLVPNWHGVADLDRDGHGEAVFGAVSHPWWDTLILDQSRGATGLATRIDYDARYSMAAPYSECSARSITSADLDGDGALDLAVGIVGTPPQLGLFWGNNTGWFTRVYLPGPPDIHSVTSADFNGDGVIDVAAATTSGVLRVYCQTSPRVFDAGTDYAVPTPAAGLAAADFNRDGRMDLAAGGRVLFGRANGTLGGAVETGLMVDVVAGDFDWDGWIDLGGFCSGSMGRGVGVAYNNHEGGFSEPICVPIPDCQAPSSEFSCTAADFNADGMLDLAVNYEDPSDVGSPFNLVVAYSQPLAGGLSAPTRLQTWTEYNLGGMGIATGDFNRDGLPDLVGLGCEVLLGSADGGFDRGQAYALDYISYDMTPGDFNADGRPDIAVAAVNYVSILLNQDTSPAVGDLTAVSVAGPPSGLAGQVVDVTWTVRNKLSRPLTAKWTDGIYVSFDPVWDINDRLIGKLEYNGTLAGNAEYTRNAQVSLPAALPGDYYLLARTDIYQDVREVGGEDDNVTTAPIHIDVPELTLGQDYPDQFQSAKQAKLYKVNVAADEDLKITLNAVGGYNELYIRYGEPPSRALFDAKYDTLGADQTARVPGTKAGAYYILAVAERLPTGGTLVDFDIRAEYLPFELTAVSPNHGGNSGRLTAILTGTRLGRNTLARLIDTTGEEYEAISVYFENMGVIYPTFDLTGLAPGKYHVQVEDGAVRTLNDAILVTGGGGAVFQARLVGAGPTRIHHQQEEFNFYVEYSNTGDVDIEAPLLIVESTEPIWLPGVPETRGRQLQLLAISSAGPAGILRPGTHESIRLRSAGTVGKPTSMLLRRIVPRCTIPIDWEPIHASIRPASIDEAYWEAHWQEILGQVGDTWGEYVAKLSAHATRLSQIRGTPLVVVADLFPSVLNSAVSVEPIGGEPSITVLEPPQETIRGGSTNLLQHVPKSISSPYGFRQLIGKKINFHDGIDISGNAVGGAGTELLWPFTPGTGKYGYLNGAGRVVEITYDNGKIICFYHLSMQRPFVSDPLPVPIWQPKEFTEGIVLNSSVGSVGGSNVLSVGGQWKCLDPPLSGYPTHVHVKRGSPTVAPGGNPLEYFPYYSSRAPQVSFTKLPSRFTQPNFVCQLEVKPGGTLDLDKLEVWCVKAANVAIPEQLTKESFSYRAYRGSLQWDDAKPLWVEQKACWMWSPGGSVLGITLDPRWGTLGQLPSESGEYVYGFEIRAKMFNDAGAIGAFEVTYVVVDDDTKKPPDSDYGPPNIDTNNDGVYDAWDTNGDGVADAWDTDGDGKPDDFNGDGKPDGGLWTFAIPWDPNDKAGPGGWGPAGFVSENRLPYTVLFENLPAASAAALKVEITDQLSPNLDWTTLQLDEIGFAGMVIKVPEGLDHYEGQVKIDGWTWDETNGWHRYEADGVTPKIPLVVDIEAGIDIETGVIHWTITSVDPSTGFWPEDPFAGFLPPNQEAIFYPDPADATRTIHPGEGYVSYSVKPKAGLATGTQIKNKASIVFDWNAAIDTPEVLNTIDAGSPTSSVAALPAAAPYGPLNVCWSGQDDAGGSGVEAYSVYISRNGGPYTLWTKGEGGCAEFFDARGGQFNFYSVAADHVGNAESAPVDADGAIVPDAVATMILGDYDGDGDVDAADFQAFEACFSGPAVPYAAGCAAKDYDGDNDVDQTDFGKFQRCFSGAEPADPGCGG